MPIITNTTIRYACETGRTIDGRTAKKTFEVDYTLEGAPPADLTTIETASDGAFTLPAIGDPYATGSNRVATKVSVKPADGTGLVYAVDVDYETSSFGAGVANPLARKDVISGAGLPTTEEIFMTVEETPRPIANTAHTPFQPLYQRKRCGFGVTIEGNRASVPASLFAQYLNPCSLNSDTISLRGLTLSPGTALLTNITFTPQSENGIEFFRIRWDIEAAPEWDLKLANRGFDEIGVGIVNGTPQYVQKPILNAVGGPLTTPWPLKSTGERMPSAEDQPPTLIFPIYPKRPFGVFAWTSTV